MTNHDPLAAAAARVADALSDLAREWEAAEEATLERDPTGVRQDALHRALSDGYPFGRDLSELYVEAGEWAEKVEKVMDNPPGALSCAAMDIRDLAERVTDELTTRTDTEATEPVGKYREWQTGGLGGGVGDVGAVLGLGIARSLADLLEAVEGVDPERAQEAAIAVAAAIREGKAAIRSR